MKNYHPNFTSAGEIKELAKCLDDEAYFFERYFVRNLSTIGLPNEKLIQAQYEAIKKIRDNQNTLISSPRVSGRTTILMSHCLWTLMFGMGKNLFFGYKYRSYLEPLIKGCEIVYSNLPVWMTTHSNLCFLKDSIKSEKNDVELSFINLDNDIRGKSVDELLLDEVSVGEGKKMTLDPVSGEAIETEKEPSTPILKKFYDRGNYENFHGNTKIIATELHSNAKLFLNSWNPKKDFTHHQINLEDIRTPEEIETIMRGLTEAQFTHEYCNV